VNHIHPALFAVAAAAILGSAQCRAQATVVSMTGDVRDESAAVTRGQRILPGTTLATGDAAQANLRFSDGQQIVLDQNTAFRIAEFHYVADEPADDRATFELLRGAMRFVSGAIGARNPGVVALRTPNATFSVRGTDFMVALANWTYLKVQYGAVGVTNLGGTVTFGANTAAAVISASSIAQPLLADALPPAASVPFSSLAVALTGAAAVPAVASGTAGAATGVVTARTLMIDARTAVKIGIVAALIGAAVTGTPATTHH
jgi:FecR protein